jgi:hypothetical protein
MLRRGSISEAQITGEAARPRLDNDGLSLGKIWPTADLGHSVFGPAPLPLLSSGQRRREN